MILIDFLVLWDYNSICGDKMINKENIELFFDYVDQVSILLFDKEKQPYLEGMNEAFNFLLDDEFDKEYNEEIVSKIKEFKEQITGVNFQSEEVRKAVQLCLLRGYKHANESNALITPDTIGIFISYLIQKLYGTKEIQTIFDPLIGTGNLLYTVANNLNKDVKVFGVDNDMLKCKLSRNLGDLLDIENEIFFQDTLTYYDYGFDVIVSDIEDIFSDEYFPYQVINHHMDGLSDGGYFISLINNDFFEQPKNDVFKEEITKKGNIFGLIKLSESLFKNSPKSILIIRKKGKEVREVKDFLLVDLPSFSDLEEFNNTINKIDSWFQNRKDDIQ